MRPWLELCRAAAADIRAVLEELPTRDEREPVLATGVGGDDTTAIDEAAERAVVARLEELHRSGEEFLLVSEELGERAFGDSRRRVVVDPIDGSVNAKRGLRHFCLSIAVSDGDSMGDVVFGYVYDFGSGEEWTATRGGGAQLDVQLVESLAPEGISYTPSVDEAVAAVDSGRAAGAFIVRPTRIEDVFAYARRGEVLPQKTTYFFPKLLSGLLFHPL